MADEWKTIRVPKSVYDDAKERKEDHGVTWGEYVNPHAWHSVFDEPTDSDNLGEELTVDVALTDIDEVTEEINRLKAILESYENLEGRIDDLETSLKAEIEGLKR
jgi:hypothetical protein